MPTDLHQDHVATRWLIVIDQGVRFGRKWFAFDNFQIIRRSIEHPELQFADTPRPGDISPFCKVSRFGLAVRRQAGKQKDLGSTPLRLSFLFKEVVVCGHCLVTLSLTINGTLKWLPSLPILMQVVTM